MSNAVVAYIAEGALMILAIVLLASELAWAFRHSTPRAR